MTKPTKAEKLLWFDQNIYRVAWRNFNKPIVQAIRADIENSDLAIHPKFAEHFGIKNATIPSTTPEIDEVEEALKKIIREAPGLGAGTLVKICTEALATLRKAVSKAKPRLTQRLEENCE